MVYVCVPLLAASTTADGGEDAYIDVSTTQLPSTGLSGNSMDAVAVDLDSDGDLDIVVAHEFGPNILLINDSNGGFTNQASTRLPTNRQDSEDIGVADFNADGFPDLVIVNEDDQTNELYYNNGLGVFTDESARLPVTGRSNAVVVTDLNNDGSADIIIGNDGPNVALINNGNGTAFINQSAQRLPVNSRTTQDLVLGDIDNDGDADLLVGNENGNRAWLNTNGVFTDVTATHLPAPQSPEETRELALGDIDDDGDLDLMIGNVRFFTQNSPANRLLINSGEGIFSAALPGQLPPDLRNTVDVDFLDHNQDGLLDLLLANAAILSAFPAGHQLLLNQGQGIFVESPNTLPAANPPDNGFDTLIFDMNGDGRQDLYLANFRGADRLLQGTAPAMSIFKDGFE